MVMKKTNTKFIFIILFTVTIALALRYISILSAQLQEEMVEYLESLVDTTADVVNRELTSHLDSIGAMADLLGQHDHESMEEKIYMVSKSSMASEYVRFGISDETGMTILSDGEVYDFYFREFMQKALAGEKTISDVLIDVFTQQDINVYATPIFNKDHVVKGVLFGTYYTADIREMLNNSVSSMLEGSAYIIDSDGKIVISCDCSVNPESDLSIFDYEFEQQADIEILDYNLKNGGTGVFEYSVGLGTKTAAYTPLHYNEWYVVVESDSKLVNKRIDKIMYETLFIFSALSLVFIGIMIYTIMQQGKSTEKLEKIAYIDPVTDTSNWNYMLMNTSKVLNDKNKAENYYAVSLDIDKFKILNDVYGYNQGNKVIRSVAKVLNDEIRENEYCARYVADNFALLLYANSREELVERIHRMIEKIEDENHVYSLNVSVGIYHIDDMSMTFALMNDRANIAKKQIKNTVDIKYAFYEDMMRRQIVEEKEIENDMHFALENREFLVYFQPKYDSSNNNVVGAEALVRWKHHDKGMIFPNIFIPLFEKNRFILQLDKYVLEETCACLAKWKQEGHELFPISVNLSRYHLSNPYLGEELLAILKKYEIDTKYIELELTETVILENNNEAIKAMLKLKEMGFMLNIDDFGSGYSSLRMLKDIPADVLKLDKGLIDHIQNDGKERIVVEHVVSLASDLKMQVICEGVEYEEQISILKQLGCFFIQGYYYSKPLPVEEFEKKVFEEV